LHPTQAITTSKSGALEDGDEEAVVEDVEEHNKWYEVAGVDVQMLEVPIPTSIGVVDHVDDVVESLCPSKKSNQGNKKIKAQFRRQRTHNDQTLVCPCGIIFARATMYGAEAVLNFLVKDAVSQSFCFWHRYPSQVMVKNAFSIPGVQKPEHLIYDSNCDAKQQVMASRDP
jgi:hypothetical protein